MKIEGGNFDKIIQIELDKYQVEVGILQDAPVYSAGDGFKVYAGQTLRRTGRKLVGNMASLAESLDKRFHWLEEPFRIPENQDVQQVVSDIAESINMDHTGKQRVLNGMQAIIRNPILGDYYGGNSMRWAKIKGFNKLLMFTGQFFQHIKARYVS